MSRLLLISCSSTKDCKPGPLPALERYQGGTYKIIKKTQREGYWPSDISVLIVSAKYGLIGAQTLIENYEQKMTIMRAREIQHAVSQKLDAHLCTHCYTHIFVNMGSIYMHSITLSREMDKAKLDGRAIEASGAIGQRLYQTKDWLRNESIHR